MKSCPYCDGKGHIEIKCEACDGKGHTCKHETVKLHDAKWHCMLCHEEFVPVKEDKS